MTSINEKIQIPEFCLEEMVDDAAILIIAKRGSGKSWVIKALLEHLRKRIPVGMIISKTEKKSPFFSAVFPDTFIHENFVPEKVEKMLLRQEEMIQKRVEAQKKGKYVNPRFVLVMDDCLADSADWKRHPIVREIMMNGRHSALTYILSMQYSLGMGPDLRTNFDYVFIMRETFPENQKKLYNHYAGMFKTQQQFSAALEELTKNYGCMVLKNKSQSGDISQQVGYFKAPNLSENKFVFGSNQMKKYDKKNYDHGWVERERNQRFGFYKKHKITIEKVSKEQKERENKRERMKEKES